MPTQTDPGPIFRLDWQEPEPKSRLLSAGTGSVLVHVLLFFLLIAFEHLDSLKPVEPEEAANLKKYTPLIVPLELTQKAPNKAKVAKEVTLNNLLARPEVQPRTPAPPVTPQKQFQAPPSNPLPPGPKAVPLPEPPKIEASTKPPAALPPSDVKVPPPQIQPVEKPKLAFETPGQNGNAPIQGAIRNLIPKPSMSVEDAAREVARGGGGQGGMVVGEMDQFPSPSDSIRRPGMQPRLQSALELKSDAMGVDFKPYLIRILATVRRNWFAVMPESVHLGRRGKVQLQFVVDKNGSVPKLVISMSSNADPLDRAAVAGISASVPFPPLPKEFKGDQIVLQFTFAYNQ
jgi:TonB family protein